MIVHVPKCARPGSVAGCSTGAATTGPHRPSEGELRAGEQLLAPQQQAGLPVLARNLRVINKNTRKATVDIVIPKWEITFKGCLWHHKKAKEWTSFLSKEWVDRVEIRNTPTSLLGQTRRPPNGSSGRHWPPCARSQARARRDRCRHPDAADHRFGSGKIPHCVRWREREQ
jgi:hypothetical protein